MEQAMVVRGLAPLTRKAYVRAVIGLAKHYGQPPDQLTRDEVEAYVLHLIEERGLPGLQAHRLARRQLQDQPHGIGRDALDDAAQIHK